QAMWTIPLTTEPRAIATLKNVDNVVDNPGNVGLSWNMDRWVELDHIPETTSPTDTPTKKS
ncbi:MAG TPA: peptide ABC transporter, partial [Corynebacterium sp.]